MVRVARHGPFRQPARRDCSRDAAAACTALRCTALRCAALHCTALRTTTRRRTALRCAALHCTALRCAAPHCAAHHYPALCCAEPPDGTTRCSDGDGDRAAAAHRGSARALPASAHARAGAPPGPPPLGECAPPPPPRRCATTMPAGQSEPLGRQSSRAPTYAKSAAGRLRPARTGSRAGKHASAHARRRKHLRARPSPRWRYPRIASHLRTSGPSSNATSVCV